MLEEHPVILIGAIVVAGLPIGFFATRYASREAQKRAIWSALQQQLRKADFLIPAPDTKDQVVGAAKIDDVLFRAVSIEATIEGLRLDRPLVAVKPISIPWNEIQRVDVFTIRRAGKDSMPGALIRANRSDSEIIVFPWYETHQKMVPENVGTSELKVTQ